MRVFAEIKWKGLRMTLRDQIARQILALPTDDRVYLADLIYQSLNAETFVAPALVAE